jgi:hypothetical protein
MRTSIFQSNFQKESWQMDADEKLGSVPKLKEEGNQLYKDGKLEDAAQKYADAIGRLEQLMLRFVTFHNLVFKLKTKRPFLFCHST